MQKSRPVKDPQTHANQRAVLEMLAEDHRHVQQMFEEFADIDDEDERRDLVTACCTELTIHAQLEEELFYPAVRDEIEEPGVVNEAQVEHGVVKDLITQLEYTEPDDDLYEATFKVLGEYANHHIKEEEEDLFRQVRESAIDLRALAEEMLERRRELRVQHGLAPAEDDSSEDELELDEDEQGHER